MTTLTQKVVIISGGTITHIRPHLALSAPAYGKIGDDFETALAKHIKSLPFQIIAKKTKMADSTSTIETNKQLGYYIDTLLIDPDIKVIILAAAVCDFDVESIHGQNHQTDDFGIGKHHKRLSSKIDLTLRITPAEKLAIKIKKERPDICLITFKTVSNVSLFDMIITANDSRIANSSNYVFANDIENYTNAIVDSHDRYVSGLRETMINKMCDNIINYLKELR